MSTYVGNRKLLNDLVNQTWNAVYITNYQQILQHCSLHTYHYRQANIQQRPCLWGNKLLLPCYNMATGPVVLGQ
jgi:hypothetical protein